MRGEGLAPNTITYTALLTACRAQPSLVPPLLLRMRREGAKVNTIVLTAAINTLTKGDKECVGNYYTYVSSLSREPLPSALIFSVCEERALRLYEEMEVNGPAPNLHTYNTVIRTLTESNRLEVWCTTRLSLYERCFFGTHYCTHAISMIASYILGGTGNPRENSAAWAATRQYHFHHAARCLRKYKWE